MRLIPDWRRAWKFWSIRFLALGTAAQATLQAPAFVTQYVPSWIMESLATFSLFCILAAGVSRVLKQPELHSDPRSPD